MSYQSESFCQIFEDSTKEIFGKTVVKINYVNMFDSGFLLYSQRDPTITVNVNEEFLLKLCVRRFLKPTVEHEFTHVFGKGKWSYLTVNYPEIVLSESFWCKMITELSSEYSL